MQKSLSLAVRMTVIAGVLGLMSGCSYVTKEELAAVDAKASEAASKAGSAASTAQNALKVASDAAQAAQAAKSAADAAQACCDANKAAIDKIFEKKMRK